MCGFLVYKQKGNNEFISRRGDIPNKRKLNGFTFEHFLLPITGKPTPQPFVDNDVVCLYNGEIYNQPFKQSDGECLIPLYKKYGLLFMDELDGEFAIALYDFGNDTALFITDPFATKPLFRNGIECASYKSGVGGREIEAGMVECVQISTGKELFRHKYFEWDWEQHKDTYDDWIRAFERSIKKRATNRCFIGLSSGYDSGAISKELTKQGIRFKAFSILNNEDEEMIRERAKYCYEFDTLTVSNLIKDDIVVEDVLYNVSNEDFIKDDVASLGLAAICKQAKREGRNVYLSGQGADEIIGDYKLYPKQSDFQGIFPKKLSEWENFAGGIQRDYIHKEEYIGGSFGIETRYPFLDKDVVQEFLWLKPELKNKNYKAPIYEYLKRNKVPFLKDKKTGFRPL